MSISVFGATTSGIRGAETIDTDLAFTYGASRVEHYLPYCRPGLWKFTAATTGYIGPDPCPGGWIGFGSDETITEAMFYCPCEVGAGCGDGEVDEFSTFANVFAPRGSGCDCPEEYAEIGGATCACPTGLTRPSLVLLRFVTDTPFIVSVHVHGEWQHA
jgi:hypothetical protein